MLKNDTLKNGTSRIGLYGSASPPGFAHVMSKPFHLVHVFLQWTITDFFLKPLIHNPPLKLKKLMAAFFNFQLFSTNHKSWFEFSAKFSSNA